MKRSNKSILLITVLLFFFIISIVYSNMFGSLNLSNAASASNNLCVVFENPKLEKSKGINAEASGCVIGKSKEILSVNVAGMQYPGSNAQFSVYISNNGNKPVKINSVQISGLDNTSALTVRILNNKQFCGKTLEPGQKCKVLFSAMWNYRKNNIGSINHFEIILNHS